MFPYSLPYAVGSFQLHETSTTPDLVNSLPQANLVSLPSKQQQKRANNIWYPDSGVTNHLTNGKPQGVEPYKGAGTVQVGNDSHIVITNIGTSVVNTSYKPLVLHNLLCTLEMTKNLFFVS